jgi:hypothetical protein
MVTKHQAKKKLSELERTKEVDAGWKVCIYDPETGPTEEM